MKWGLLCLVLLLSTALLDFSLLFTGSQEGVEIKSYIGDNPPAEQAGLPVGAIITQMNGKEVRNAKGFLAVFEDAKPGDKMEILAGETYAAELGERNDKALLGVNVRTHTIYPYYFFEMLEILASILPWLAAVAGAIAIFPRSSVISLNTFNLADIALTGLALARGAQEVNPFATAMINTVGFWPLVVLKIVLVLLVSVMLTRLRFHKSISVCASFYAGVIVINAVQLAHTIFL